MRIKIAGTKKWESYKSKTYDKIVKKLKKYGCKPGVYKRGDLYRFHINLCGNWWDDQSTPLKAARSAYSIWFNDGRPMDGMACEILTQGNHDQ